MPIVWGQPHKTLWESKADKDGTIYTRAYTAPASVDWDTLGYGVGDILPAESGISYAEILQIDEDRQNASPNQVILIVRGFLSKLYTSVSRTDVSRELHNSRIQTKAHHGTQIVRRFEINDSAMSEGALGWVATSGLPVLGDAYPSGTYTIKPVVSNIEIDPSYTTTKTLVTVTYTGLFTTSD